MSSNRFSVKPYLQLIRLPNVFTAGADSLAGWLFVGGVLNSSYQWICLVLASMAAYAGGIALNDFFDAKLDAIERPDRPIPSGKIGSRTALILSLACLLSGFSLACLTRQAESIVVVSLLIASVLAYDCLLRTTRLGPQNMGLCRALNLLLGMTCSQGFITRPAVWVFVLSYGLFVTGITWISRDEANGGTKFPLKLGTVLQSFAFAGQVWVILASRDLGSVPHWSSIIGLILLVGIFARLLRFDWNAISNPAPSAVQKAVKTAIFSLIWLHLAILLGVQGFAAAAIVGLFWIPTAYSGRWIYST